MVDRKKLHDRISTRSMAAMLTLPLVQFRFFRQSDTVSSTISELIS